MLTHRHIFAYYTLDAKKPSNKKEKRINVNITEVMKIGNSTSNSTADDMTTFPAQVSVGMAYVPYQVWQNVYDPQVAIERGTIFEDLDKPFIGERAV